MERIIIGVAIVVVVIAALVVSATQTDAADPWQTAFDGCLAASTYQNALTTYGWDSPQELDAWFACVDEADAALATTPQVGDTVLTTNDDNEIVEAFTMNAADAMQANCIMDEGYAAPGYGNYATVTVPDYAWWVTPDANGYYQTACDYASVEGFGG